MMKFNSIAVIALTTIAVAVLCTGSLAGTILASQGLPSSSYSARGFYQALDPNPLKSTCADPTYAFDGNVSTSSQWVDWNYEDGTPGSWIAVDLGYSMNLDSIRVFPSGEDPLGGPNYWSIDTYVSNDMLLEGPMGTPVLSVVDQIVATGGTFTQTFPSGTIGRYVLVNIVSSPAGQWGGFYEIHVFAKGGTVTGQITSSPSGTGIANAQVASRNGHYATTTGPDGSYSLDIPAGNVELVAYAPNRAKGATTVSIDPDTTGTANMALASSANGVVTGSVYENMCYYSNRMIPIPGVEVSTADGMYSTTTAADGS